MKYQAGFQKSIAIAENEIWRDVTIFVMISGYVTAFVAQRYAIASAILRSVISAKPVSKVDRRSDPNS